MLSIEPTDIPWFSVLALRLFEIPAKAGIRYIGANQIPAFAGISVFF
jgi:hypothetical protein